MEVIKDKKQAAVMPLDHITPRVVWTPENKIKQIRVPKRKKSRILTYTHALHSFFGGERREEGMKKRSFHALGANSVHF